MNKLLGVDTVRQMVKAGKVLMLAGDEKLLQELPKGKWIGGTIPYFMGDDGGVCSDQKIYVTELPDYIEDIKIKLYRANELPGISSDYPVNGASFIIIPAGTDVHKSFARDATTYKNYFNSPVVGWISGVKLEDLETAHPKVFDGNSGVVSQDQAVVMHISLPKEKRAKIDIINLFRQGDGDSITFEESGFTIENCLINGEKKNFAEYLRENNIDTQLPLVADYCGAMVNVSIQSVKDKSVDLYAPVFNGVQYKFAKSVGDYAKEFEVEVLKHKANPIFSCNCILNYLYAGLEGHKTANITGPITFGEVAYMLLNQTMVYISFENH